MQRCISRYQAHMHTQRKQQFLSLLRGYSAIVIEVSCIACCLLVLLFPKINMTFLLKFTIEKCILREMAVLIDFINQCVNNNNII